MVVGEAYLATCEARFNLGRGVGNVLVQYIIYPNTLRHCANPTGLKIRLDRQCRGAAHKPSLGLGSWMSNQLLEPTKFIGGTRMQTVLGGDYLHLKYAHGTLASILQHLRPSPPLSSLTTYEQQDLEKRAIFQRSAPSPNPKSDNVSLALRTSPSS
jgi:hypothetical protein